MSRGVVGVLGFHTVAMVIKSLVISLYPFKVGMEKFLIKRNVSRLMSRLLSCLTKLLNSDLVLILRKR